MNFSPVAAPAASPIPIAVIRRELDKYLQSVTPFEYSTALIIVAADRFEVEIMMVNFNSMRRALRRFPFRANRLIKAIDSCGGDPPAAIIRGACAQVLPVEFEDVLRHDPLAVIVHGGEVVVGSLRSYSIRFDPIRAWEN